MRKVSAIVTAAAAGAGLLLAGAPAAPAAAAAPATAAAYPFELFGVTDYSAPANENSYYSGRVTWYNRSVTVDGTFHAYGCRRVYATAWAGITPLDTRSSSTHCNNDSEQIINLVADVPGGSDHVYISLTDANGKVLDSGYYFRP
ncbi:hypothetical protein [Actinacidiphila bryophytorum]|uniref:hypothetical protein n=1 Tax=Actinacidiphila bryophytorum TaxID=1436133 RepID=UPI002176D729|nr:hypothetical protein [Actinacidiphila bryophytorum]UWE10226.1 hypothetical protein NYE86_16915 [Actinacidiphila bryophytorum]